MARANFLDRAIGYVAPGTAARRLRNRMVMDVMSRGYDGARIDRKNRGWRTAGTSADTEIAAAAPMLRDRMRDLVRNNPHAANAVAQLTTAIVGDGIIPRAKTGNARRNKKVNDLFWEFVKKCDHDGRMDFFGIQSLAVRGMIESGDGLVRRRLAKSSDGLPVPLQLQVVETDQIDSNRSVGFGGRHCIQGIEFDDNDKRVNYWMFPRHPGNNWMDPRSSLSSAAIPASDIAHIFEPLRTSVRGVPWGTPAITSIHGLGGYEEAEIVRKKIESCMVGVLVGGDENDGIGIPLDGEQKAGFYDADGFQLERFEPGMFAIARGGRDVKFNAPAATGSYEAYKKASLHTIAAGFRMPYALLSGDLSKVNYSSSKVGLETFRRLITSVQWQIVIPMLCQPLWDWFCEAAYLAGKIDTMTVPVEWTPPRFISADLKKDVEATVAEVRAGLKSPQKAIAETGEDPDEVLSDFIEWNEKLDAGRVVLDSDPRRVTHAGQAQSEQTGVEDEDSNTEEAADEGG